jgi:hypothetical protein
MFLTTQRFGNWMFPSSGKMMGTPTTLLRPLESVSVGVPMILPENGNRFSFRNVAFLETLDDGQSQKT